MIDPVTGAALISAGGNILSGMLGGNSAKKQANALRDAQQTANEQNTFLTLEQMRFQERMSNTAHQREVKDLRDAGLNPVLSAMGGSGASSPVGATPNIVSTEADAANSALAHKRLKVETAMALAETASKWSQAKLNKAAENKVNAETAGVVADNEKRDVIGNIWSDIGGALNNARDLSSVTAKRLSSIGKSGGRAVNAFNNFRNSRVKQGRPWLKDAAGNVYNSFGK